MLKTEWFAQNVNMPILNYSPIIPDLTSQDYLTRWQINKITKRIVTIK